MKMNGGFASPNFCGEGMGFENGMTLRQWYAGQTLAGLCANSDISKYMRYEPDIDRVEAIKIFKNHAYQYADAMIAFEKNEETEDASES